MTDETEPTHDEDSGATVGHDLEDERTTAPMSAFSPRDAAFGFVVMVIGVAITLAIPMGLF
ncbi:DUF7550 family protein [Natronosalvus rutilus]|uniref:Uncharacterized protein n=1 Tax=Natronosalvus rutilus TaxID=2953753 RepID=A0A9E7NA30_9EURY|nr:hypothetical protein [Natronosalvus rutilus]UTF53060.1 hypothetical protein NGM29_14955 [Natronosalvus rutilus]